MTTPRTPDTPELQVELAETPTPTGYAPADAVITTPKEATRLSKNPNAMAVLVSSQVVLAGEKIAATYLDAKLGSFWSQELMAGATTVVLYIGRDGLKSAFGKVLSVAKAVWSGPPKA